MQQDDSGLDSDYKKKNERHTKEKGKKSIRFFLNEILESMTRYRTAPASRYSGNFCSPEV